MAKLSPAAQAVLTAITQQEYCKVDEGEVIYWQPLPKWPAHALPLPAVEVEP